MPEFCRFPLHFICIPGQKSPAAPSAPRSLIFCRFPLYFISITRPKNPRGACGAATLLDKCFCYHLLLSTFRILRYVPGKPFAYQKNCFVLSPRVCAGEREGGRGGTGGGACGPHPIFSECGFLRFFGFSGKSVIFRFSGWAPTPPTLKRQRGAL